MPSTFNLITKNGLFLNKTRIKNNNTLSSTESNNSKATSLSNNYIIPHVNNSLFKIHESRLGNIPFSFQNDIDYQNIQGVRIIKIPSNRIFNHWCSSYNIQRNTHESRKVQELWIGTGNRWRNPKWNTCCKFRNTRDIYLIDMSTMSSRQALRRYMDNLTKSRINTAYGPNNSQKNLMVQIERDRISELIKKKPRHTYLTRRRVHEVQNRFSVYNINAQYVAGIRNKVHRKIDGIYSKVTRKNGITWNEIVLFRPEEVLECIAIT